MLFNSFTFLGFFAAVAVAYYLLPHRFRWPLLLAGSLFFYATFDASYVFLLLAITLVAWGGGIAIERTSEGRRRNLLLAGGIAVVAGALLFFKYYGFLTSSLIDALGYLAPGGGTPLFPRLELVLVVGLSFYTFSCISYLVDVHREKLPAERHLGQFALYVAFFPKLLAGPIERAGPFLEQIRQPVHFSAAGVTAGLQLLLWGLFKKVVVADNLAVFVDGAYTDPAFTAPVDLVLATYFFAFQLYCDFSGYSDMAIGASGILGIRLMENFRRPYLSRSTQEFWAKRWHISLATWFRDYMYIPLGGNRVSRLRQSFNVLSVFLVSGLWHGANWTFVVWGGLNGLYHVISEVFKGLRERIGRLLRLPDAILRPFQILLTFHLILLSWVFFRADSMADAVTIFSRVQASLAGMGSALAGRMGSGEIRFLWLLIAILMIVEIIDERRPVMERLDTVPRYARWAVYYAIILALLVVGNWASQDFVYMQF
jgi:alginate O-acetyltransferase complex protein AlgI